MDKQNLQLGNINLDTWNFSAFYMQNTMLNALNQEGKGFPYYEDFRFATTFAAEDLFEEIVKATDLKAARDSSNKVIYANDNLVCQAVSYSTIRNTSFHFSIIAKSKSEIIGFRELVEGIAGDRIITRPMISINWYFLNNKNELNHAFIEELADPPVLDEAYPFISNGVYSFIDEYLSSSETILVLQGPPGTGKTRFIRAVLASISEKVGRNAEAMITSDFKVLDSDEIFIDFITGSEDVFIVEDSDHLLTSRGSGNELVHKFLNVSDGVIQGQGRKIIFSTNLPNVNDIDDAILRPGRCFDHIQFRYLDQNEAHRLYQRLNTEVRPSEHLLRKKAFSVAEIYKRVSKQLVEA